jgi:hypothetical protein
MRPVRYSGAALDVSGTYDHCFADINRRPIFGVRPWGRTVRFGGEPEMSGRTACLISTPFCFALDLTVSDVVHPATVTLHRMDTWRAVLRPVDV